MSYTISYDVPPPEGRPLGNKPTFPLRAMKIGGSILVEQANAQKARVAYLNLQRNTKAKEGDERYTFKSETQLDGSLRIWRIVNKEE